MRKTFFLALSLAIWTYGTTLQAALSDGSEAPDFTQLDINGNTHTLSNYLSEGKMVVLDFFATWCGPCWNYHNTHALADLYDEYGPNGSDEVMVFGMEADLSTDDNCIYGFANCSSPPTLGDWTEGVPYPIINITDPALPSQYNITYFPTIYTVCSDQLIYESGQVPKTTHATWLNSCNFEALLLAFGEVSCFELSDGFIDVDYEAGHGAITYDWSNGESTQDISDLLPGNYAVTMTEGHGRTSEIYDIIIGGPTEELTLNLDASGDVFCFGGQDGFIQISTFGGTPGYDYSWNTGEQTEDLINLTAGSYTLEVTDANGCLKEISHFIDEPPLLTLSFTEEPDHCEQGDGILICNPVGGSGGYLFDIGYGPLPTEVFTDLVAGDYSVTLTDINGCERIAVANIPAEDGPMADAGPEKSIDCENTSISLDGLGDDDGDHIIEWGTDTGNIVEGANTLTPLVDAPGSYFLTITNEVIGCVTTDLTTVAFIGDYPVADAGDEKDIDCAFPSVNLDGSGSSSGSDYTYNWTTDDGNIVEGENSLSPEVDASGTYTLEVENTVNGCTTEADVQVAADFNEPQISVTEPGKITCTTTELSIDGTDSEDGDNISYDWQTDDGHIVSGEDSDAPIVDQGGTYTFTALNSINGCTASLEVEVLEDLTQPEANAGNDVTLKCGETELTLDGLNSSTGDDISYIWDTEDGNIVDGENSQNPVVNEPGIYTLTVSNAINGCTAEDEVEVLRDQDLPLADAGAGQELTCELTSVALDGSGSDQGANFSYEWHTTDGNIVAGEQTLYPEVDEAGVYELRVRNNDNNCVAISVVEVTEFINEPTAQYEYQIQGLLVQLTDLSQGEPFSVHWDFGDGSNSEDFDPSHIFAAAGNYDVCLTIENECGSDTYCQTLSVAPSSLSFDLDMGHVSCFGGHDGYIEIFDLQGNGPFSFDWSTGDQGSGIVDLYAGEYILWITDTNNETFEFQFDIEEPEEIEVYNVQVINQIDQTLGSIHINVRGGTPPYRFDWSHGATTEDVEMLEEGEYSLLITDANNCERTIGPFVIQKVTAVGEIESLSSFNLFPNRTLDDVWIELHFSTMETFELQIFNAVGNLIWQNEFRTDRLSQLVRGDSLEPGVYFITVSNGDGIEVRRLIVQ